ncbi:MAG: hypothetical protein V3T72_20900, partial [Thermoanaerobaculia bacterium]
MTNIFLMASPHFLARLRFQQFVEDRGRTLQRILRFCNKALSASFKSEKPSPDKGRGLFDRPSELSASSAMLDQAAGGASGSPPPPQA